MVKPLLTANNRRNIGFKRNTTNNQIVKVSAGSKQNNSQMFNNLVSDPSESDLMAGREGQLPDRIGHTDRKLYEAVSGGRASGSHAKFTDEQFDAIEEVLPCAHDP